ncbi:hypothetical protein [Rubinisphaera sp.]|uniref:hypothetical protein n=1 Tax=Rubinisphaera sp. TaxID=2024857 RepID=UPI0025DF1565|nr:hypothetical protein [Rubinisphaera sp.]
MFDDADQPCELKIPPDIDHKQVQYLGIKGWKIELPPHCIVCGKKTKRVFHIEEQIFSLGSPLLVISIGFAMTLLLWGNQVGWLIILPSVLPWLALGYYISRKIPVELAYSRCKNHAESAVSPQLRIFERGLIIEVEHRRIRREFFRPEEFDFNTVNDSLLRNTAAERRETWHDASENGESEFEIQQALSSGVFLEKVATTDGSTQYQQTPIQVHNGQCPQCDHQIKTNINQCPKCDMSFIIGSCNVCGNSCSIDTPCKCGASLIVSCESTQNQFCRGCGSNWDGTTKYSWPSTSKKVSYCPRCLIDQRAQIKVPIGIKNPDHYRLAAFDRKISKAKLAAKNEHKAEISERHSHFFRGLIGAAVGGDAAWGYAAAGNSKNMPHKDRMELASLQRIRRLYLLQTDLKYATKWERREIEWGVYIRKALLWSVVISVTLIVILIAALVIFSATNSVE